MWIEVGMGGEGRGGGLFRGVDFAIVGAVC